MIAPVLVCAVAASTTIGQRCRITGMVTLDSCCPQAADEADPDSSFPGQATVGDAGCCERLLLTVSKSPGTTDDRGIEISARPVTALVSTPDVSISRRPFGWVGLGARHSRPVSLRPCFC